MLLPRSRSLILLLGALTGLTALSIDMSLPTLPTLGRVFQVGADRTALTLSLFLAGYSASQLFYGPLADRFGRRPPLVGGLVLFAVGGVGCAASFTMNQLVFWRLVQGIGACAGPIIARAVVRDLYERQRAVQILSYLTLVMSVAPLAAPIVGGYLLLLHWRAPFGLLALIGLAVLTATWSGLPESIPVRNHLATRPRSLLRGIIDFFGRRACAGYAVLIGFVYCGLYSYITSSSYVLIEVFGVASNRFGFLFGLNAFAMVAGAMLNARLVRRVAPGTLLAIGIELMLAGGAVMVACTGLGLGGLAGVVAPMLVYIFGMGMVTPNAVAAAMEPVPHMAGFASSLIGCLQSAAGSLVGYLLGAVYDRSARPMAAAIAASAALAALTYFAFLAGRTASGPASAAPNRGED